MYEIGRDQLTPENPEIILGKGSFGEVSLQTYHGEYVAVKKFIRQSSEEEILREIISIINIRAHKYLPIVYGVSLERRPFLMISKFYGSSSGKKSTTLQYYLRKFIRSGDNYQTSDKANNLTSVNRGKELLRVAGNICEALYHIHMCGYLHGDLKSNNILLIKENSNLTPKVIDFGKSCKIDCPSVSCVVVKNEKEYDEVKLLYSHMAKELFFGKPRSVQTDIFAYGVLLSNILQVIKRNDTCFNILVEQALSDDPEKRPTLSCISNIIYDQI